MSLERSFRCRLACGHEIVVTNVVGHPSPLAVRDDDDAIVICHLHEELEDKVTSILSWVEVDPEDHAREIT